MFALIPNPWHILVYDTILHQVVRLKFWSSMEHKVTHSLLLLPGLLRPAGVVSDRVSPDSFYKIISIR